jgi:hypothetical protein
VSWFGLALIVAGAGLFSAGIARARGPWRRYRALKTQEDNIARYEAWRGGLRDSGVTGASVAMELLRKQVRDGALLAVAGVIIGAVGLFSL